MGSNDFRLERDSMGELKVAADALWGAQTERARHHFAVSGRLVNPALIRAGAEGIPLGDILGAAIRRRNQMQDN